MSKQWHGVHIGIMSNDSGNLWEVLLFIPCVQHTVSMAVILYKATKASKKAMSVQAALHGQLYDNTVRDMIMLRHQTHTYKAANRRHKADI